MLQPVSVETSAVYATNSETLSHENFIFGRNIAHSMCN